MIRYVGYEVICNKCGAVTYVPTEEEARGISANCLKCSGPTYWNHEVKRLSPGKDKVMSTIKQASNNVRSWESWKEGGDD